MIKPFKKYSYLWFTLILSIYALHITQSQKVAEPIIATQDIIAKAASALSQKAAASIIGTQGILDKSITQDTQPAESYILDDADKALIAKARAQTGQETSISLTLPTLGTITLHAPAKDQPLVGHFPQTEPLNLSPLPVLITSGTVTIDTDDKVTITGAATVFGQSVQLSLQELHKETTAPAEPTATQTTGLTFTGITLRIVFNQASSITLFPGKAFTLSIAQLVLDKDKPPTLIAPITLFNQKAVITFGIDKNRLLANFSLDNVRLGDLIPPLSTTPFAGITLKQVAFSTNQALPGAPTTEETDTVTTITGNADFSSLKLPFDPVHVNNVKIQATLSRRNGFNLTAELSDIQLPVLGHLEDARFVMTTPSNDVLSATHEKILAEGLPTAPTPQEMGVSFKLEGKGTLTIPNLQPVPYTLEAEYAASELVITGTITTDINFKNITIKQMSFRLNPTTRELAISGESSIEGFDIHVTLYVRQNETTQAKTVVLEGAAKNATVQPFAQSGIPGLSSLTFSNIKVGLGATAGATTEPEVTLGSTVRLFNQDFAATVHFVSNDQGARGAVFDVALPEGWKFPGTSITFSNAHIIGSTIDYTDPITHEIYTKGLSLAVQFELPDQIAALMHRCQSPQEAKLVCQNKTVTLIASFDPANLSATRFGTKLSDTIVSTEKVDVGPVFFYLEVGTPPTLLLDISLVIKPSPKDKNLVFRSTVQFDPIKLIFAASLRPEDRWQNPFGIQGFAIGGLGAKLGINFAQFAATGLPAEIGLAGAIQFSDRTLSLAALFDTHFTEMALRGQLQGELSLVDLIRLFAQSLVAQIPQDKIPHIAVKNVLVKFAPKTVTIEQIVIEQGLTLRGTLDIFNLSATLDFNVDIGGIRAKGYTNAIALKDILFISGDSPQGGPIFDLQLTPAQQYVHLNGSVELKNITKTKTFLDLTPDGIRFNFSSQFGDTLYNGKPLLYAQVVGSANTLVNPQFSLAITFEQTLNRFILDQLNQSVAQSIKQIQQAAATAQANLSTLTELTKEVQQKSDSIKSSIDQAQQAVKTLQTHIDTVNRDITSKQQEVQKLKDSVDQLQAQINAEKNRFNNLSVTEQLTQWPATGAKLTAWGTELAAKQVAYSTAQAVLNATQQTGAGVLSAAQQAAQAALTVAQDFLNAFLTKAAPSSIAAAQTAAIKIPAIIKNGELGVVSAGQQVGTFIFSAFDVRRIYFNSNLDNIKAGVLANVQADLVIAQHPITLNFNLDVHNVAGSITQIIKEGQDLFNKALTNTGFISLLTQLNQAPAIITQAKQALEMQIPSTIATNLAIATQAIQKLT